MPWPWPGRGAGRWRRPWRAWWRLGVHLAAWLLGWLPGLVVFARMSRHVSRILFTGTLRCAAWRPSISACRCRQARAAYPQASGGQPSNACAGAEAPSWPCSGWGLPSRPCRQGRWWSLTPPFHPYPGSRRGGLFSVALSRGSPLVAVNNHPALWSPDFPRRQT